MNLVLRKRNYNYTKDLLQKINGTEIFKKVYENFTKICKRTDKLQKQRQMNL